MNCFFVMVQILFIAVTAVKSRRAFLEIILYNINQDDGRYTMHRIRIDGEFSNAGTASTAEGDIIQMHPHSLCDDAEDSEKFDYGWVGVVKLSYHGADPCHVVEKARRAVGQGATAVIFDVSDHPDALRQLNENSFSVLNQPIVLVKGMDATELMKILNGKQIARAVIKGGQPDQEDLGGRLTDPAVIVTCILLAFIVICVGISKVKCRKRQQQASINNWTARYTKMKKYRKQRHLYDDVPQEWEKNCSASDSSSAILCAICLESFQDGEDLRVLECQHEFHMDCIDIWLKQKRSCPLCNRSFSNLSKTARSAVQLTGDTLLNPSMTDGLLVQQQSEMQLASSSLIDGNRSVASYGATLLQEDVNLGSRLSDTSEGSSNKVSASSTSDLDGVSHQRVYLKCNSCKVNKQNGEFSDHRDSVLRSHRKKNPRRTVQCTRTGISTTSSIALCAAIKTKQRTDYCVVSNCDCLHSPYGTSEDPEFFCDQDTVTCGEDCNCRINGASDTSILALHGSSAFVESSSSFFSSISNTSKCVKYSSDPPVLGVSEYCDQLIRSATPCIEYSSSDGASNLGWLSYSTLEDVLGAIENSSSGLNS